MTNRLEWEKKVWGKVLHVFNSEHAAVSYLVVNEGFQCSRHYHRYRVNQFTVISGRIAVEKWYDNKMTWVVLDPGESYTIWSKIEHRFRVIESGQIIEIYWPDVECKAVELNDIVRLDVGGPIEEEDSWKDSHRIGL